MRLLLVSPYPDAGEDVAGGVQAAVVVLAAALANQGVDVSVLVLDRRGRDRATWMDGPVAVVRVPYHESLAVYRHFRKARAIVAAETAASGYDVVHAHGVGAEGVAVASLPGPLRIVTPHGDVAWDLIANRSRTLPLERWLRQRSARVSLQTADAVVTIGPLPAKLEGVPRRTFASANPLNHVFLAPVHRDERPSTFLVPAAVKRIKSIDFVIDAAERAASIMGRRVELRIAGPITDKAYHAELEAIASAAEAVTVSFLGSLSPTDMAGEYDRASAMVLGSRWEVSPVSAAEAMVRACPVILPDLPGPRAMLDAGSRGWLFRPQDADALAAAMLSVRSDARVDEARSWALERFAPDRVASRLLEFYRGELASAIDQVHHTGRVDRSGE